MTCQFCTSHTSGHTLQGIILLQASENPTKIFCIADEDYDDDDDVGLPAAQPKAPSKAAKGSSGVASNLQVCLGVEPLACAG